MSRDPKSYRFQIRVHHRDEGDWGTRHEYGVILWTEPDVAVDRVPLVWRVSTLCEKADQFSQQGEAVAAGIVDRFNPDLFQAEYFVREIVRLPAPTDNLHVVEGVRS